MTRADLIRKLSIYLFIPGGVCLALIAMYFSGVDILQKIVSPNMPRMHRGMGREFGLLENLQNLYLLAMVAMAAYAVKRKTLTWERMGWAVLTLFSIFIFLEEIDYGLHYYEYARGVTLLDAAEVRNIHNQGDNTSVMKRGVDILLIGLFLIIPLACANSSKALIRYITPTRWFILTLASMFILSRLAHGLKGAGFGEGGTINKNLSEFRELTVYYMFMVYIFELVYRRTFSATPKSESPSNAQAEG